MCLGIPGQVVRWINRDGPFASADIEFNGIRRVCHMACVPDAKEGDFVIVHAGVAISRLDPASAEVVLEEFRRLGDLNDWTEVSN